MPEYEHVCKNTDCNHEWEDFYSIHKDPPTHCPKCNQETAKRVISFKGGASVRLSGDELTAKIKADAKKLQRDAAKDEKIYSNLIGEDRYNDLQTKLDRKNK